jgi:hypothetical protein
MAQPHEVLGVAANADEATINTAFRSAAKRFHPDLNNGDPSGIKRLRRLIAARDFLTKRRWRPVNGQAVSYLLPSFRKNRITKSVALTFAFTCAFAFLLLPVLSPAASDNPPPISVVKKTSPVRLASAPVDADVPDAGSAEIKAIRDLQEAAGYSRASTDAADPLLQNGNKRPSSSPADGIKKAVKGAAALVSKAFHRIASEL